MCQFTQDLYPILHEQSGFYKQLWTIWHIAHESFFFLYRLRVKLVDS
ncbi:MAG TPA: hypothetical protein PLZ51_02760 [Aggregatilineales bacterium]|nr:hypothetical protein [Aggregatilineales bacterium]